MGEETKEVEEPVPASTVILVRDYNEKLQIYLLKRSDKSGFFPGNYVFPGGVIDPEDSDVVFWKNRSDLKSKELMERFGNGMGADEVLPFLVSAIRETFEEAGVFFATGNAPGCPAHGNACEERKSRYLEQGWMHEWFERNPLILGISNLWPWSHWITPRLMKKRFNTLFFIAFMPADQICIPDNREMTDGIWKTPCEALSGNLEGSSPLSPPTIVTMQELLKYQSVKELKHELEDHYWEKEMRPRYIPSKEGAIILEPWDPLCDSDADIDPRDLEKHVLSPCEPFSRLLLHKGIWKPVGAFR